jgi:FtsP/CotA-like multicopper oxidase with cupredoxin domain
MERQTAITNCGGTLSGRAQANREMATISVKINGARWRHFRFQFLVLFAVAVVPVSAATQASSPCPRFPAGSTVTNPPAIFSRNGTLSVDLSYNTAKDPSDNTAKDEDKRTLYCFTTPDGAESPTLHVHPGDHLIVHVKNNLPAPIPSTAMRMTTNAAVCGAASMNQSSINVHFHGTNTSPRCHQDEVINTLINPGETFKYDIVFPKKEPPGLYWYHPHIHGYAESAVLGGASGALVVDGIEAIQPAVAGLPQRIFVIRDQDVVVKPPPIDWSTWDLTLNYVPISYPELKPAIIKVKPNEKQFWRVVNACANTILDPQVVYDGSPQQISLVALDGVPLGSQDGTQQGKLFKVTQLRLPPGSRMEFIVTAPSRNVKIAQFLTQPIDTGHDGDRDPQRTLADIRATGDEITQYTLDTKVNATRSKPWSQLFEKLLSAPIATKRLLFFSEKGGQPEEFYISLDGKKPEMFSPARGPDVTTTQGSVEDWTIQNRSLENHEFHIHQIHFEVRSQDNFSINGSKPVQALQGQLMDTIEVPYWDGIVAHPYPSVTLRMDFRATEGDFVYHCHILNHEDRGMMAIIRVLPRARIASHTLRGNGSNQGNSQ